MFKFRNNESCKIDLDEFREKEIQKLLKQYNELPSHHTKAKNGVLESILLLKGDLEVVKDVETMRVLQEIKSELINVKGKLSKVLLRD